MLPDLEATQAGHLQSLLTESLASEERGLFSPLFAVKQPVRRRLPTGDESASEPVRSLLQTLRHRRQSQ